MQAQLFEGSNEISFQYQQVTPGNTTYGVGRAAAGADPDGDGYTNEQEYYAGTDPLDANSFPMVKETMTNGADFVVKIQSVTGKTYTLQRRDELTAGDWADVPGSAQSGNDAVLTLTDPDGALQP